MAISNIGDRSTVKDNLTVGIIGCGEITTGSTAPALSEVKSVKIGMVMDVVEWAAKDLGTKYGAPYTTDVKELLSNPDIDFVYIAVPHYLHAPLAIEAARAKKHVIVEKPISVSLEKADEMIAECRRNGVKLSTCFPSRYSTEILKAKELIDGGRIGKIIGTKITSMGVKPDSYWMGGYSGRIKSDWRKFKDKTGGGILIMNSVHDIDYMRYVTGLEAKRVYSEYGTFLTPVEVEDFINVVIRYANGAIGTIEGSSCIAESPSAKTIRGNRIYGSEGEIIVSNPLWVRLTKGSEFGEAGKWNEVKLESKGKGINRYFDGFVEAVLSGGTPPVTGEDGRKALEIIVAAYQSGLKSAPVTLPL
jgi:UDP-N-acetyl-2-amino-2-deoxyglucuronate dehydrogenase